MKCRKKHQNDPRSAQKRPQEEPKTTKKAIPNDKTTREPNQDDFKTVLDPSQGRFPKFRRAPGGSFGRPSRHQNGTKNDAKTQRKFKSQKNRSKTILDSSWGDLGPSWAPSWADLGLKIVLSPRVALVFLKNHFFDVKTVRRRLWDQLWPTKASKLPKMTPKTEPKSTPRRSKIDVKIVIKNDAKTMRARHVLARRHLAGTSPQGSPGGAPGTQGRRPRPHGTIKKS